MAFALFIPNEQLRCLSSKLENSKLAVAVPPEVKKYSGIHVPRTVKGLSTTLRHW